MIVIWNDKRLFEEKKRRNEARKNKNLLQLFLITGKSSNSFIIY